MSPMSSPALFQRHTRVINSCPSPRLREGGRKGASCRTRVSVRFRTDSLTGVFCHFLEDMQINENGWGRISRHPASIDLPVAISLNRRTRLEEPQQFLHLGAVPQRSEEDEALVLERLPHAPVHSKGIREGEFVTVSHSVSVALPAKCVSCIRFGGIHATFPSNNKHSVGKWKTKCE